jgi:hypothetical protein
MKRETFSARRRQLLALAASAAGALAAPALVMAGGDPVVQERGGKIVVSGRIIGATGARPLAGAQVEIWQADARGMRIDGTREVATADGDGRYFAVLNGAASRLHYRVSHKDHTTRVAQVHVTNARQREAIMTRDHEGTMRVAFEMKLTPRNLQSVGVAPARTVT